MTNMAINNAGHVFKSVIQSVDVLLQWGPSNNLMVQMFQTHVKENQN